MIGIPQIPWPMTQRCSEGYNGTGIDQGKEISAMGTKFLPKINSIFFA
jgi:hypothetical protein